ncbi:hypothetical protein Dimus_037385 [Dionaea muscipula]
MGIAFNNQVPRLDSNNAKFAPAKFGRFTSTNNELPIDSGIKFSHDSQLLLPLKGLQAHMPSSSMDAAAQELRALSLMSSNNSWRSCDTDPAPLNAVKIPSPLINLPTASLTYWHGGQSVTPGGLHSLSYIRSSGNQHQEFRLFKDPQDPSFYLY